MIGKVGEQGPRGRVKIMTSLPPKELALLNRLVAERGLGNHGIALEFLLANFAPWILSESFQQVLAEEARKFQIRTG